MSWFAPICRSVHFAKYVAGKVSPAPPSSAFIPERKGERRLSPVALALSEACDRQGKAHLDLAAELIPELKGEAIKSPWLIRKEPYDVSAGFREGVSVILESDSPADMEAPFLTDVGGVKGHQYRVHRFEESLIPDVRKLQIDDATIFGVINRIDAEQQKNLRMEAIQTGLEALRRAVRIHQLKGSEDHGVKEVMRMNKGMALRGFNKHSREIMGYLRECLGRLAVHYRALEKAVASFPEVNRTAKESEQWKRFEQIREYYETLDALLKHIPALFKFSEELQMEKGSKGSGRYATLKDLEALLVSLQGSAFGLNRQEEELSAGERNLWREVSGLERRFGALRGELFLVAERGERWDEETKLERAFSGLKAAEKLLEYKNPLPKWDEPLVIGDRAFVFLREPEHGGDNPVYSLQEVKAQPDPESIIKKRVRGTLIDVAEQWKITERLPQQRELDFKMVDNAAQGSGIREVVKRRFLEPLRKELEKERVEIVLRHWRTYFTSEGQERFRKQPTREEALVFLPERSEA